MIFEGDTAFREPVVAALKTVYDPEIPVDIYELGLIYGVRVAEDRNVRVEMTLTSPACPSAEAMPLEVKEKIAAIQGLEQVNVDVVWDPPWTSDRITPEGRARLRGLGVSA